jgi:hypothetical protein
MSNNDNAQLTLFINRLPHAARARCEKPTIQSVVIAQLSRNWHKVEDAIRWHRIAPRETHLSQLRGQQELATVPLDMHPYDEAILGLTVYSSAEYWNALGAHQIPHTHGGFVRNCARCGGGLGLTECNGCGARFEDDYYNMGWDAPLPRTVIDALEARGHQFALDPRRLLP